MEKKKSVPTQEDYLLVKKSKHNPILPTADLNCDLAANESNVFDMKIHRDF